MWLTEQLYKGPRAMKKLPIGLQTFSELVEKDYVYVDKTGIIHEIITRGKVYFFARPRRFGKSLLISTMQAIFEGKRELFKGLAIDQLDYDWKPKPAIRIDFSGINRSTPEEFVLSLKNYLVEMGEKFGITLNLAYPSSDILRSLVAQLHAQHGPVVLLVDEYDKPILDHLKDPAVAEQMRVALRNFYDVFKYLDNYLHFVFITGVSKFTQTSIFSGLNNLHDLSNHPRTATLCGYTKEEIKHNFGQHIQAFADKINVSFSEIVNMLEHWYDGYSFTWGSKKVFNPFSVLNALDMQGFQNFWATTGTPNFLATMFKGETPVPQIDQALRVALESLVIVDLDKLPFVPVLAQTGYLTIVGQDKTGYILDFPNYEVSNSYALWSLAGIFNKDSITIHSLGGVLLRLLEQKNFDEFFTRLIPMFASIPHDIQVEDREKYYQSILYLLCMLVGLSMDVELSTNIGTIDAVIKTDDSIVIFEYKLRGTAQEALDQIKNKKYYERFLISGKKIVLVCVQFCMQDRNIKQWLVDIVR
jgi:hypothetical protein